MEPETLLKALTVVLCTAGLTSVLFQRLRQPVVLGYILAGLIVGPHVPIPLIADRHVVEALSDVGVILLMFALGLEFSLGKLFKSGPTAGLTAVIQCSIMVWLGFLVGQAFGWTTREAIFTGAIIAISSTTIIAKAFDEQGIRGKLRELVVGVLIVEDLVGILLMAALTTLAAADGLSAGPLLRSTGRLLAFLAGLLGIGMLIVPRAMRAINRLQRSETTLVASVGLCFAVALLAHQFGYSVALGAFIAGSLIAESGEEKVVEPLIQPVRDMFAAIFFVSVGMLIEPRVIAEYWLAILVLTFVVIVGKVLSVSIGAFLAGNGIRTSVQAGMSLAQIGEFSFIIAGLGVTLGSSRDFIYAIAVAVSALTTLTTPWLIRASEPVALWIDRKLPHSLQTFSTLYGSWVEALQTAPRRDTAGAAARRLVLLLALDAAILAALGIGVAVGGGDIAVYLVERLRLAPVAAHIVTIAGALALAVPFAIGIFGITRRLGITLAEAVLPSVTERKVDFADAPRRAFVVTLQLAMVLLVCLPLVAVLQPFLPRLYVTLGLCVVLVVLGFAFWRSTQNLQGHVKAGTEMIVEVLSAQSRSGAVAPEGDPLAALAQLLPGLGEPATLRIAADSAGVGKTLAQLNVRGRTGATVLAIRRGDVVVVPSAKEVLRAGDVLAVAGTHAAVDAARALLAATGTADGVDS